MSTTPQATLPHHASVSPGTPWHRALTTALQDPPSNASGLPTARPSAITALRTGTHPSPATTAPNTPSIPSSTTSATPLSPTPRTGVDSPDPLITTTKHAWLSTNPMAANHPASAQLTGLGNVKYNDVVCMPTGAALTRSGRHATPPTPIAYPALSRVSAHAVNNPFTLQYNPASSPCGTAATTLSTAATGTVSTRNVALALATPKPDSDDDDDDDPDNATANAPATSATVATSHPPAVSACVRDAVRR